MEINKLHKSNLTIVWVGIAAMIALSLLAAGGDFLAAVNGCVVLVIAGVIGIISYKFVKDDLKKAMGIILAPALATTVYAYVVGGNSVSFLCNYLFVAMTALYFEEKYIKVFVTVMGIDGLLSALFFPIVIDGNGGTLAGALTKVTILIFEAVMLILSVRRGRFFIDQAEETLALVRENGEAANGIAQD